MKRILLFLATNLAIMITLSIVLSLLGIGGYRLPGGGLDYSALMVFCLVWGMGGAFISLALSRFIAKRAMGVQLVDGRTGREELDWLHGTVRQLTERAGLPMPEVGIYDSPEVNAFATGPSKRSSLVAVSSGLMRSMRREEIEGVLAHEVSHIQNGDMVTMTLIQGVVNAFSIFFSRVIANIIRQLVDERISHLVFIVASCGCDGSTSAWLAWRRCSAAIMLFLLESTEAPASARNSRARENQATTIIPRMLKTMSKRIVVTKKTRPEMRSSTSWRTMLAMTREKKIENALTTPWIIVMVTMSPFWMCESSWARTPSIS